MRFSLGLLLLWAIAVAVNMILHYCVSMAFGRKPAIKSTVIFAVTFTSGLLLCVAGSLYAVSLMDGAL